MADEEDLKTHYQKIRERGWAVWIHGIKEAFNPQVQPGWKRKAHDVSVDRRVTIAWDPKRFVETPTDDHEMVEVYRTTTHKVVLFSVAK